MSATITFFPENADNTSFLFSILNTHFQAQIQSLDYSINPEAHLNHGFTDLLVTRNNHLANPPDVKWQIIFEGKAGNGDNYLSTLNQLNDYAKQVFGQGGWCYLIAARGRTCMFWRYQKNTQWNIQPMSVNGANVAFTQAQQIPWLPLSHQYDIVDDQAEVLIMLTYITNNGPM